MMLSNLPRAGVPMAAKHLELPEPQQGVCEGTARGAHSWVAWGKRQERVNWAGTELEDLVEAAALQREGPPSKT